MPTLFKNAITLYSLYNFEHFLTQRVILPFIYGVLLQRSFYFNLLILTFIAFLIGRKSQLQPSYKNLDCFGPFFFWNFQLTCVTNLKMFQLKPGEIKPVFLLLICELGRPKKYPSFYDVIVNGEKLRHSQMKTIKLYFYSVQGASKWTPTQQSNVRRNRR